MNRGVAWDGGKGAVPLSNCLQNRTCKKFKSGEILSGGGGGGVRQAAVHFCVIISIIIICTCASRYCKNQLSAQKLVHKLVSEGPKFRESPEI